MKQKSINPLISPGTGMTPTASSEVTLSAVGLSRLYGANIAVRDMSLDLKRGEVVGLLGPNGAGKTTTMQMITGNLAPSSGSVEICGIDLIDTPSAAKARIGYLPEAPPLYRELRVDEYLRLAGRLHKVKRTGLKDAVARAKQRCGLSDMGPRLIGSLSKGYRQRVGIAQAIIHNPDVIILDEPTIGLDPNQIREIRSLIRALGNDHSVILSTHILPEVEAICDRVQILHRGEVVFADSIAGLRQFRGGHALQVAFRRPPSRDELRSLISPATADVVSPGQFRVIPDGSRDPTDQIVRASAERDWGLYQLQSAQASLEEVFVQLTQRDADEPTAEGAST
ncbi:MAG: ABC transporter ATP-binding protein [Burkholderiales bacterium]